MSRGDTVDIVPEAWTITDGKLYLNYSKGVRETWLKDMRGYIKSADGFWPEVLKRLR